MKKGLKKLILSGAALAAVAATGATSTYAWYTTNTNVSANNIQGQASAGGDSSIFISSDTKSWSQSVDMIAVDSYYLTKDKAIDTTKKNNGTYYTRSGAGTDQDPYVYAPTTSSSTATLGQLFEKASASEGYSINQLFPVEFNNTDKKFYELGTYNKSTSTYTASTTAKSYGDGAYLQFNLYFKTSKTDVLPTLYIKSINVQNTADPIAADNLLANSDGTGKAEVGVDRTKDTYAVDIVNALAMTITSNSATKVTTGNNVTADLDAKAFDFAAINTATPASSVNVDAEDGTNYALNYYNQVMGTNVATTDSRQTLTALAAAGASGKTALSLGKLPGGGAADDYITVNFKVFLNGWDALCFDSCKGQGFKINMSFTSVADEALTI